MPRIDPYRKIRERCPRIPIGVLSSHGISGESGARILYCNSAKPALNYVRRVGGRAVISRTRGSTRWIRMETGAGVTIYPGTYCTDASELIAWRDYCYELGIPAAGIAAMGMELMRSTLPGYFEIHDGTGIPWSMFPPGPRMHALPGLYKDVIQADIRAAYLWSIGELNPPVDYEATGHRRRVNPKTIVSFPGSWAEVVYRLNHYMRFGPIAHLREDGTTGFPNRHDQWTAPVLVSSFDLENILRWNDRVAEIKVRRAWLATKTVSRPFAAFMYLITELREKFPQVAKQAGNTLWGTFGASTDLAVVEFLPGSLRHKITSVPPRPALAVPVAALTLSRLRARTMEVARWTHTIHVHTDGYMSIAGDSFPTIQDGAPGEWRLANRFAEVEILSSGWYRYVDAFTGSEHFKLAGRPSDGALSSKIFHHARDKDHERG